MRLTDRNGRVPHLFSLLLIALVKFYQKLVSPLFPKTCRFHPTCSHYAVEAIQEYGPGRGSWLALKRILRCHPFHPGGWDPVPKKQDNQE